TFLDACEGIGTGWGGAGSVPGLSRLLLASVSYVVLARKYRPLRFEDMVGQEHVTRTLRHAIEQGRVHHAYLFAGARGLGKTTTARVFAKGLVCQKGPSAQPCNAC